MVISCRALNNIEKNNKRLASVGKVKCDSAIVSILFLYLRNVKLRTLKMKKKKSKFKIQNSKTASSLVFNSENYQQIQNWLRR